MSNLAAILWHRLDQPGHDACRLDRIGDAWQLDGTALFRHEDARVAQLHYRVRCDRNWHTQWGTVRGWLGGSAIDVSVARSPRGEWKVNDLALPDLSHCVDLDLGFTPATNLIQLRRLNLQPGEAADAPAAWLDLGDSMLTELAQRYERRSATSYWYHARRFNYEAVLDVTADGFVRDYPRLWLAEP
ncbi:MAG: putative glycolipid-binding domain-containing protein [Variovorax sp.]